MAIIKAIRATFPIWILPGLALAPPLTSRALAAQANGGPPTEGRGAAALGCRNEPSGFKSISSEPFDELPPRGPPDRASRWVVTANPKALTIVDDPTGPLSPGRVIAGRFPRGHPGGRGPFRVVLRFGRTVSQVYMCTGTKLSPGFTNNGNWETKWGFYLTPYTDAPYKLNHYFKLTNHVGVILQSHRGALNRNMHGRFNLMASQGRWHKVEILVVGNSRGLANGTARVWVDDRLVLNETNVRFFYPDQEPAFNGITWNPTYGGGRNPVPADQYQYIDHWYVSGR